jgi:hypothetical protein
MSDKKSQIRKILPPSLRIESEFKWYKRLYVLIKNPVTYLFKGYVEY